MSIVTILMRHSRYHSGKGAVTAKPDFVKGKSDSATLLVSIPGAVLTWIIFITVIFRLGWSM